jgi:hypothetical protein
VLARERDVLYSPRMMGCLCGRGLTIISICGFAFAKFGRWCFRNALLLYPTVSPILPSDLRLSGVSYFIPFELPAQSQ